MQTGDSEAGTIPIIQLDDWSLTIAVHYPETAKRLAGLLIQAAAKREQTIRKAKEMTELRGNNARSR